MSTLTRLRPAPLRTGFALGVALVCAASAGTAPRAVAQQYAVPAGEAIVLDGGGTTGGHADPRMHAAYRTASAGTNFSAAAPQVRSTQYPQASYPQTAGMFEDPVYSGPVVSDSVCDGCDAGFGGAAYGGAAYGEEVYDGGFSHDLGYGGDPRYDPNAAAFAGGGCDGGFCDAGGCDGGFCDGGYCGDVYEPLLSDRVCGSCGTVGCTPGTCDPTCTSELACGGPVVCNKFGRCGKFYTYASGRQSCGFSAGYGFLFLRPHVSDATAAVSRRAVDGGFVSRRRDFDFDLTTGSRIFAELIRPDAVGLRVTYSGLESNANTVRLPGTAAGVSSAALPAAFAPVSNVLVGSVTAGAGDVLTARNEVQFSVFDVDATRRLRAGNWLLNTGGGLRFARLEQNYSAVVSGRNPGAAASEFEFDGAGLTGYAEARRPIGQTGFAFLTSARIALLAGENDSEGRTDQNGVANVGRSTRTDFVPTGELQVGGEWSAWLNQSTLFFTQLAYEGQIWGGVGGPGAPDGNVSFTGFNLTLGLEW